MRQQAERADFVRLRILPSDDQGAVGLALVCYVRQARTFARANVTVPSAQRLVSSSWIASGEDPVANPSTASGLRASNDPIASAATGCDSLPGKGRGPAADGAARSGPADGRSVQQQMCGPPGMNVGRFRDPRVLCVRVAGRG